MAPPTLGHPYISGKRIMEYKPDVSGRVRKRRDARAWRLVLLLCAVGLLATATFHGLPDHVAQTLLRRAPSEVVTRTEHALRALATENPEFVWGQIEPSEKLEWVPCYGTNQCARFSVPLDYTNPDDDRRAAIALLRIPAKVDSTGAEARGPVFFNPGGPGNSGVAFILKEAERYRKILGDEYDLIGFDPRGIGRTTPQTIVFDNDAEETAWNLRTGTEPLPNATDEALARFYARQQIFGTLAANRTADVSPYVGTAFVARDLLRMAEAHGRDKLQYWGFSYGTVLGITFASMFPDKVERLVIDGVEDTYDYYATLWSNNLLDTDASLQAFVNACVAAGPDQCALYNPDAFSVRSTIDSVFAKLKLRPLFVESTDPGEYGLVDVSIARRIVFNFLYRPYGTGAVSATQLAHALASADKGDGRPFWDLQKVREDSFVDDCSTAPKPPRVASGGEMGLAVACGDGDVVEDSLEALQAHFDEVGKTSSFVDNWTHRIRCSGWKTRAKERFTGPFVANTSTPLLFIGNTLDPVTPLVNAKRIAQGFPGSGLLTQESGGHCTFSSWSSCTAQVVRAYFVNATLPAPGKVCDIDSKMFSEPKVRRELNADLTSRSNTPFLA